MKLWLVAVLAVVVAGWAAAPARAPGPSPVWPFARGELDRLPAKLGLGAVLIARQEAEARARRRAIARARRSPTVPAALRVARLTGRITRVQEVRRRREWARAQAVAARLAGVRGTELGYVVGTVRALAAAHLLTTDRIDPLFLALRVNTRFWPRAALPAAGWRTVAGEAVFQYYPGRGLQIQPLASWGRVNGIAGACLRGHCRTAQLRRALDALRGLGAQRHGYLAWEYYFAYGSGAPPWVSGMAQATAVQALARGYKALGAKRWRRDALAALGAFEQPPPNGVAVPVPGGTHYLLYSFAPGHRVFNGGLQAVIGLRDAAVLLPSRRARRLFRRGERAARREVAAFDTGAWSLYSERGAESTLNYHALTAEFLGGLCSRLRRRVYCDAHERFERYEREPTRIAVAPLRDLRADRVATLRFTLSKVSTVEVRLWGRRGLSLARDLQLPRGAHALAWRPPGRGRYRLRIEARGPSGPAGVAQRTFRITLPKPPPKNKKHAAPRHRRAEEGTGPRRR